ncbi:MAG: sigma-70 family RNA polymerase sigma factor [Polyangiaceae bacterium]|nr:sigma-70 family RNA polymerase sigma factor [Polyangiaceae bacterium]
MRTLPDGRHFSDVTLVHPEPAIARGAAPPVEFAAIFREHAPYAMRLAHRLGVADADLDDLCQEVFLTVHRRLPEYEGRGSMRSFVFGICVRVAANYRRRAFRRKEVPSERPPERGSSDGPAEALDRKAALHALDRALATLGDDHRAVFVLFEIEELTMNEVAEAVGCPLKTAYSRLYAARAKVEEDMRLALGGAR